MPPWTTDATSVDETSVDETVDEASVDETSEFESNESFLLPFFRKERTKLFKRV